MSPLRWAPYNEVVSRNSFFPMNDINTVSETLCFREPKTMDNETNSINISKINKFLYF